MAASDGCKVPHKLFEHSELVLQTDYDTPGIIEHKAVNTFRLWLATARMAGTVPTVKKTKTRVQENRAMMASSATMIPRPLPTPGVDRVQRASAGTVLTATVNDNHLYLKDTNVKKAH